VRQLSISVDRFPLARAFVISRGAKTEAVVVVVEIRQGDWRGRGECTPYLRYGETPENVVAQIESVRAQMEAGADRDALQNLLPPGAARNALDCALWDLDAKRLGVPAFAMAGLHRLGPATTCYTISVGEPAVMAAHAREAAGRPILKIKLAGEGDPARLRAVREAAPDAVLVVDANEAWTPENLERNLDACAQVGVALVEQPLPAGRDEALERLRRPIPVCADESAHDRAGLPALRARYDAVNVKLDKTGGLTEALALCRQAETLGFSLFVGCMVASSLAMAPAMLLSPKARFVDLDGPLLLAHDRPEGLRFEGSTIYPPEPALWG
jgi:L-alanine-DL-glutamate epimerase-like enolase superfamily enzyme